MASEAGDLGQEEDGDDDTTKVEKNGKVEDDSDQEEEEEDEEDEEPRLEYTSVTKKLTSVYRNGDATSAFLVAGDKMVRSRSKPRPCSIIVYLSSLLKLL